MTRRRRYWSRLPPELLERIAGALDDIADRVRFGAVCKPWQSAASTSVGTPRRRLVLPWLHLPSPTSATNPTDDDLQSFFSLSGNRIYTLPLPPGTRTKALYESSHGYVLAQDHYGMKNTVHLLNPITRTHLPLPPFPPLPPIAHCAVQRWKLVTKSGSSTVMLSVAFGPILICEKGGGGEWGEWREIPWVPIWTRLEFAFHQGNYFVFERGTGQTSVVDPRSLEEVSVIPSVQLGDDHGLDRADTDTPHCHYLVESSSQEELYLVVMSLRAPTREEERFEVFRLDRGSSNWQWMKVRTIGEDMMFVDYRNAVALSARDFRACRGSCIYFVDYGAHCPCLFDMESGGVEEVPNCWDDSSKRWKHHGWIIPTM